ncbi:MAG: prolipoprotein diacylglyceryl transferase [Candidatus Marinimicrobia bacterium]|nr:prolipoprotein diacylglyceryl transferase [Candidatus Neomarinimicrobiota bacterium]
MWPIVYDFGIIRILGFEFHLAIYSYGLMLVVAFYTCYALLFKEMKRLNYDENIASDIVTSAALGGIIGSKIYYLIENIDRVIIDPYGMIFSGAGLVFLGGLMGGTIGVTIVLKKNTLPWLQFADIIAPLLIIGYSIGRIGCFLVGDDYGLPTKSIIGISFEKGAPPTTYESLAYNYPWLDISNWNPGDIITVYPTQIIESILGFGIFIFLWNKREDITTQGSLFFIYLIIAGMERFFIEFIRLNPKYLWIVKDVIGFSGAQVISLIMVGVGIYLLINPPKNAETKEAT